MPCFFVWRCRERCRRRARCCIVLIAYFFCLKDLELWMFIGKIVKSDSHINYVCQIYGPREVEVEPVQADDPDEDLNRVLGKSQEPVTYAVGVIYDTILQNPAYGVLGPRLSNEAQVE